MRPKGTSEALVSASGPPFSDSFLYGFSLTIGYEQNRLALWTPYRNCVADASPTTPLPHSARGKFEIIAKVKT